MTRSPALAGAAGTVTTRELRRQRSAIAATRLASSAPFTGTCPTAYDGTDPLVRVLDSLAPAVR